MELSRLRLFVRARIGNVSRRDILWSAAMGEASALLLLPLLANLHVFSLLSRWSDAGIVLFCLALFVGFPAALSTLVVLSSLLPFSPQSAAQFGRYGVTGIFNTALSTALFNSFILATGVSRGPLIVLFSFISFALIITQAFFWNILWTFRGADERDRRAQYVRFFLVSGTVALVNTSIIHVLVNVFGAPAGLDPALWANIALAVTIVTAVLGNFLGYKFLVFSV